MSDTAIRWIGLAEEAISVNSSNGIGIAANTIVFTAADVARGVADLGHLGNGTAEAVVGYSASADGRKLDNWERLGALAKDGVRGAAIAGGLTAPVSGISGPLFRQGITTPAALTPKAIAGGTKLAGLFNRMPGIKFGASWNPTLKRLDLALRPYGGASVPHLHLSSGYFKAALGIPTLANGLTNACK